MQCYARVHAQGVHAWCDGHDVCIRIQDDDEGGKTIGRCWNVKVTGVRILLKCLVRRFGNKLYSTEWLVKNFLVCPVKLKGLS